jgi:hypothetical protein
LAGTIKTRFLAPFTTNRKSKMKKYFKASFGDGYIMGGTSKEIIIQ